VAKGQAWQAQLDRAFVRLDRNGDGFISLDEIMGELPENAFKGSVDPEGSKVEEVGGGALCSELAGRLVWPGAAQLGSAADARQSLLLQSA
jgi:hypothetical protein